MALLVLGCLACGQKARPDVQLVFAEPSHDFGPVQALQPVTVELELRNDGAEWATNIGMRASSSGSWFTVVSSPPQLGPGSKGVVRVVFDPPDPRHQALWSSDHVGTLEARVGDQIVTMELRGTAVAPGCYVASTIDFGDVTFMEPVTRIQRIANLSGTTATSYVSEVEGPDAAVFKLKSPSGEEVLAPQGIRDVSVTFTPTDTRAFQATVRMRVAEGCPEQTVQLLGNGLSGELTWTPAQVGLCGLYAMPGTTATSELTFINNTSEEVTISAIKAFNNSEFWPSATELQVAPLGGTAVLTIYFKPAVLGPRQTQLTFHTDVAGEASGALSLKGFGGGPDIDVPSSVDFEKVAYVASAGFEYEEKLQVMNVGVSPAVSDPAANLLFGVREQECGPFGAPYFEIAPANANTFADEFIVSWPASYDPAAGLEAKIGANNLPLTIKLKPSSGGAKSALLKIHSNDSDEPVTEVRLTAEVLDLPECNYAIEPVAVQFRTSHAPKRLDEVVRIKNLGTDPSESCLFRDFELRYDPRFSLTQPIPTTVVGPGDSVEVPIRLELRSGVTAPAIHTGTLHFMASSGTAPNGTVPLSSRQLDGCFFVTPDEAFFGTVAPGCKSATKQLRVHNLCGGAVSITGMNISPASSPFSIVTPLTGSIAPNGTTSPATFAVQLAPVAAGVYEAQLLMALILNGTSETLVIPLHGTADASGIQTDRFTFNEKADSLWVMDDSCSTSAYQQAMAHNVPALITWAQTTGVDWRAAVTTTDMLTVKGKHLEPAIWTSSNPAAQFATNLQVGPYGSGVEQGLDGMRESFVHTSRPDFFRFDASIAVALMTDENDNSLYAASPYLDTLFNLKGELRRNEVGFSAIAPGPNCGTDHVVEAKFAQMVTATSGTYQDVCSANYVQIMQAVGQRAFGDRDTWLLTQVPQNGPTGMTVKIEGITVPVAQWTYDFVANAVKISQLYLPQRGETVEITYPSSCF